jgi:hypothetical protein
MQRSTLPTLVAAALAVLAPVAAPAQATIPSVRLPAADTPLTGATPVAWSVGVAEGADHEMFGEVTAVAFDARDNLYVLDRMNTRVMVYDRNGRFVRQIGSRGGGPGEFQAPLGLAVAPDGTVYVSDPMRRAVSIFAPDGTFVRNAPVTAGGMALGMAAAYHPAGGLVAVARGGVDRDAIARGNFSASSATTPLVMTPFDGGEPVTLFEIPRAWRQEGSTTQAGERTHIRITTAQPPTFTPPILFGVLPGGETVLGYTPGYTLRVLDAQGRTLRYLQRPYRPRPATERDRQRARERELERLRSGEGVIAIGGGDPGMAARVRQQREAEVENMQFADTIPALAALRITGSGTLWIERTAQEVGDPGPIDIVSPEGRYVGTLTGMRLPAAISRGGLAAYVERDELDVPRVVVRRLPDAWR